MSGRSSKLLRVYAALSTFELKKVKKLWKQTNHIERGKMRKFVEELVIEIKREMNNG